MIVIVMMIASYTNDDDQHQIALGPHVTSEISKLNLNLKTQKVEVLHHLHQWWDFVTDRFPP